MCSLLGNIVYFLSARILEIIIPFQIYLVPLFSFLMLFVADFIVLSVSNYNAEVLCSIPRQAQDCVVLCEENMCVR
jgi:hypothetical protein